MGREKEVRNCMQQFDVGDHMIKEQLEEALQNIASVKQEINDRRLSEDNEYLENYYYEILDLELRLKDMINYVHKI